MASARARVSLVCVCTMNSAAYAAVITKLKISMLTSSSMSVKPWSSSARWRSLRTSVKRLGTGHRPVGRGRFDGPEVHLHGEVGERATWPAAAGVGDGVGQRHYERARVGLARAGVRLARGARGRGVFG